MLGLMDMKKWASKIVIICCGMYFVVFYLLGGTQIMFSTAWRLYEYHAMGKISAKLALAQFGGLVLMFVLSWPVLQHQAKFIVENNPTWYY